MVVDVDASDGLVMVVDADAWNGPLLGVHVGA